MMLFRLWRSLCLFIFLTVNFSFCLYEDQVGKFDWKQKFVGKIKFSHIDLKSKVKRVFVATESNVVASLSLKSGSIVWRQVLESGDAGTIRHFYAGNEIITVSGNGPYLVRGWNPNSGVLMFEWAIQTSNSERHPYWHIDQNGLYQIRLVDGRIEISTYGIRTGSPVSNPSHVAIPGLSTTSECAIVGDTLGCLNIGGTQLTMVALDSTSDRRPSTVDIGFPAMSLNHVLSQSPSLLLTAKDGSRKIVMDIGEEIFKFRDVPPQSTVAVHKRGDEHILVSVTAVANAFKISGEIVETGESVGELSGRVQHSLPLMSSSISDMECGTIDARTSCYLLLTSDDDSAILLSPSRVVWIREEALASIVSVEMLDLPVSDVEAAIEKEFASKEGGMLGMFVRRVSSQLVQLRTFVGHLLGLQDGGALGSRTDMVKDPFGLHKLIVVVTRVAKIYGIDSKNGEIVWQYLVKDVEPCSTLGKLNVPLYIQRTTRVLPHPAQWTMLFRHKVTKNSVLFVFNPINGYPLKGGVIELGYKVVQAILLPAADSEFIKGLVLLSSSGRVDVFPPSTKQMALATAPTIFMYTIDPSTGIVSGYTFAYSTPTELIATLVWNVKLPLNIVAVKGKNPQEKVHSQGRVLGDRSVLYKYINPNLVALATLSQDPIHKSVLSVFLLDVVSGRVILSVVHKRASEPIHVVHSENWVAYSYFNDKSRRTEMVALDLYEGKSQTNTTAFSSITQRIDPFIERQAYIFPYHILAMKETITEKGITSKHILVGLGSGGVMEVPWALLDPRRPVVPTMEMREEGVIPYMPELALPHEAIITYNHTLPNIAGIVTSPAGLESTCLVFVYGLDLFYTQVAPSKTFDVLKDDFEYWLISAVLVGLTLAAYITKRLASRKALRQAWK